LPRNGSPAAANASPSTTPSRRSNCRCKSSGGREDRIIPVADAEALASRLPVHIIEQTGHLPHMEKAGEVNRLIKRLIENQA
jgi:pimeloyl-ACP methyl ester carboxylesterase